MHQIPFEVKITYLLIILLVVIVMMFLIFIIVLTNRKQVLLRQQHQISETLHQNQLLQKELDFRSDSQREQERISQDLHDDLGAGINGIKMQIEYLKMNVKDEHLQNSIHILLQSCTDMNHSMRELMWSLDTKNDHILSFVNYVSHYAENFFKNTDISVQIYREGILPEVITSETKRNLFLCVKEALNNVYKHSSAKNVVLKFVQSDHDFTIQIQDDGIGMEKETSTGNGFANMNCRMRRIHGKFEAIPASKGLQVDLKYYF